MRISQYVVFSFLASRRAAAASFSNAGFGDLLSVPAPNNSDATAAEDAPRNKRREIISFYPLRNRADRVDTPRSAAFAPHTALGHDESFDVQTEPSGPG